MSVVLFVIAVALGVLVGIWLTSTALGLWASSEAGRRRLALIRAEERMRQVQTVALNHMATAAERSVYSATTGQSTPRWPSDDVPGDVIDVIPYGPEGER